MSLFTLINKRINLICLYRASDWPIREPSWKGVLQIITKENEFYIKLNEVASGMPFGKCPVDKYPGPTVETVADSSRYFVIKVANEIGQTAFLGIGFENRSDSVEFTTVLQNHFKYVVFDNILMHITIFLFLKELLKEKERNIKRTGK